MPWKNLNCLTQNLSHNIMGVYFHLAGMVCNGAWSHTHHILVKFHTGHIIVAYHSCLITLAAHNVYQYYHTGRITIIWSPFSYTCHDCILCFIPFWSHYTGPIAVPFPFPEIWSWWDRRGIAMRPMWRDSDQSDIAWPQAWLYLQV